MSPVTQYIYNGKHWQAEDAVSAHTSEVRAAAADAFVLGTTKPIFISPGHASNNVGNKYGVTRTNYAGTINFANGPVNLSNLNVSSLQNVTGAGHQFTNVLFTGSYAGDAGGGQLMATASSVSDLKLDFCEFRPSKPGDRYNGIYGHDFTASRCAIERTVDGLGVYNRYAAPVNVELLGSWIGRLAWYDNDGSTRPGGHTDGSHNDGIQHGSGSNLRVIGNVFNGAKYNTLNPANVTTNSSGLMTIAAGNSVTPCALNSGNSTNRNPQQGQLFLAQHSAYFEVIDITFEDNWLINGDCGFKLMSNKWGGVRADVHQVSFKRNKYSGAWRDWGGTYHYYPARWDSNCTVNGVKRAGGAYDDTDGNIWENLASVPVAFRGKPIKLRIDAVPVP